MQILFPIGRLVGGSVNKLKGKLEKDGKTPKIGKDGNPMVGVNFGVAIPKTQARWQDESYMHPTKGLIRWGDEVFNVGKGAAPTMHLAPTFAWKIGDGDSALPNKKGKIPNQMAGHLGNWIIWFSQGWAPKLVTGDGATELPGEKFVAGYYVQVFADVSYNNSTESPGVYMNPIAVALAAIGEVIAVEVDTTSVGFGGGALPAGAQAVPAAEGAFGAGVPPATALAVPVQPNTSFMTAPIAPPAAPVAPVAPRVPVKTMTAKAGGATYEQFKTDPQWTDELMVAQGYLVIS